MIKDAIGKVVAGRDLSEEEMKAVFDSIMTGGASQAQIGAFITALRMKGEKVPEITGALRVMREKARKVSSSEKMLVDTCGTGGDGVGTFNISTTAAFVTAGAGVPVAKHGNRAVSSKSGSADLLNALGVKIETDIENIEQCLREVRIGFLFAPLMHGAMKYAVGPRREIGIRTIFNLLGPMTNPAGAKSQVIGVYSSELTEVLANVLKNLGSRHVFVVHGEDGLDEITLTGKTKVSELKNGKVRTYSISPKEFGMKECALKDLKGGGCEENAKITFNILRGKKGPKLDIVLLNAGAAITASGKAETLSQGVDLARESINSGQALQCLEGLKRVTNLC